jgi:hypothetical protein
MRGSCRSSLYAFVAITQRSLAEQRLDRVPPELDDRRHRATLAARPARRYR